MAEDKRGKMIKGAIVRKLIIHGSILMALLYLPLDVRGAAQSKPKVERNLPIVIVADKLEAYSERRMVVFSGNTVATQGLRTIKSDQLTLFYKEEQKSTVPKDKEKEKPKDKDKEEGYDAAGSLERAEAKGNVKISEGERIITGDEAIFEQDAQKITMTGNAVMKEGANVIKGDKIVVFLNENRGVVESVGTNRVTATVYPDEKKEKKP
jgi:lipopolysaccharide export system protein LptA